MKDQPNIHEHCMATMQPLFDIILSLGTILVNLSELREQLIAYMCQENNYSEALVKAIIRTPNTQS